MASQGAASVSVPKDVTARMWVRFLAPYYVCNAIALLMYVPIRYQQSSEALTERENLFNLPLEYEILLLAVASWLLNYRKKATIDGVISLFFFYGKMAVLASLYYLDIALFGWYAVVCFVLYAAVGQPKYEGPSNMTELNPALMEKLVKKSSGSKRKGPSDSWLIFYYADWSDSCVEHEAMLADMSVRYSSSSLHFGRVDVNQWVDLAVENRISVSTSSYQLPTLILFQDGEEVSRLPRIDDNGKVTRTILDRTKLVAAFKLEELKEGKIVEFKPETS